MEGGFDVNLHRNCSSHKKRKTSYTLTKGNLLSE